MSFEGTWIGSGLSLQCSVTGSNLSGTLQWNGQTFSLTAQLQPPIAIGTVANLPFAARVDGDTLWFQSQLGTVALQRVPEPAKQTHTTSTQTPATETPTLEDGATLYRHATGGAMVLPRGWQITQSNAGLQLVPPEQKFNAYGPAEFYLVSAQPAPGVTSVDDPRVLAVVDATVRQLLPTLALSGPPQPSPPGIVLRWQGRNPLTNDELLALAYLQLANNAIASVFGLGERALIEQRAPMLEKIFTSFHRAEKRRDPALVGLWHHWSYKSSSSVYSSTSTSHETRKAMYLHEDGRVEERAHFEGTGSFRGKDSYGNEAWNAGYASQSGDGRAGTWSAGEGMLFFEWSDGSFVGWQYRVHGSPGQRHLDLFTPGSQKPVEWTEQRVEV